MGGFRSGKGIRKNAWRSKKLKTYHLSFIVISDLIKNYNEFNLDSKEIKISVKNLLINIERIGDKKIQTSQIKVITMPCNYGGLRYFGCCPFCQRRVRTLYLYDTFFACRHCLKMSYVSQNEILSYRLRTKRNKIGEKINYDVWNKPKWMRKKTFSDLRTQFLELKEKVELSDFFSLKNYRSVDKAFSDCPSALLSIEFFIRNESV